MKKFWLIPLVAGVAVVIWLWLHLQEKRGEVESE